MEVEIKTINDLNEEKWNRLLKESPHSTVYHTKSWAKVWEKSSPGSNSFFIICIDEKGDYQAGIPVWQREKFSLKSLYSMPFGTYGGLIKKEKTDESLSLPIYEKLSQMIKSWRIIRTQLVDFFSADQNLQKIGFISSPYYTHLINLDKIDESNYMQNFTRKRREGIRQSQRRGIRVEEIRSLEDVKPCYQLSWETWRGYDIKIEKFPLQLFENIFTLMSKGNLLKWFIAIKDARIVGSLINFVFKDTLYSWEGGTDPQELNARPNDALFLQSILWAKKNGLKIFNFGATPQGAESMIKFKESWGAERKEYLIYEKKKRLGEFINRIRGFSKK